MDKQLALWGKYRYRKVGFLETIPYRKLHRGVILVCDEYNQCIINSDGTTEWEQRADWAARNGVIFIKSAGNSGVTIDENGNIINRNKFKIYL